MKNQWKLLTFMIGGNDFCSDVCYQTNATQWLNDDQEKNLIIALKYLKENMPRTIVNLVPSPLINLSFSMDNVTSLPVGCYISRPVECSCLFGPAYSKNRDLYRKLERNFVKIMERVSYLQELHTNDFTVVFQPFFKDASVFYKQNGIPDLKVMSFDCIHLSQKGHAVSANGIWNNMMEPVGKKSLGFNQLFKQFNCPSQRSPFIYTNFNSG